MRERHKYKIIRERFEEMLKTHTDFFRDEKGNPITAKVGIKKTDKESPLKMNRKQDLAYMLSITPQALSNNISGKFSPSMETLVRIGELYNINWKWLCDPNEYKSNADKFKRIIQETQEEGTLLENGIKSFLNLNGYELVINRPNDNSVESIVKNLNRLYTITNHEKEITLGHKDFNLFANKICDLVDLEMQYMMKDK